MTTRKRWVVKRNRLVEPDAKLARQSQVPIASVSHQKSRSSFKHSVSNLSLKRSTPNLLATSSEVALDFTLIHERERDRFTDRNPFQPVHHKKSFLGGLIGGFNKNRSTASECSCK